MKGCIYFLLCSCFLLGITACSPSENDTEGTVPNTKPNTDETKSTETDSDETIIGDGLLLKSLSLDDDTVLNPQEKSRTYTVLLPDGRPRVPRIQAEADNTDAVVKIYNPMFAQGEAEAVGKAELSLDGQTVSWTVIFKKDKSKGFVLQYDDRYT